MSTSSGDSIVYLDNNATTRPDDRVIAAMTPLLAERYGNPSSLHRFGAGIAGEIERARGSVARLIAARESEIVFTSGGTEANNLALRGVMAARPARRKLVISAVEHHAVLAPAEALRRTGAEVVTVGVDRRGALDLSHLAAAVDEQTALVSLMLANNETGAVFPIVEAARIAHDCGALLHTDAVNALGKISVDVAALGADLASFSAHKLHGPKGCGALFIREGAPCEPLIVGGPQERERRGGTLNAAAIVGFGVSCEIAQQEALSAMQRVRELRDSLEAAIRARIPAVFIVCEHAERLPNTSCVCLPGVSAEPVLLLLSERGICASSGAACSSGALESSHVLRAMGVDANLAQGQLRFSLSRHTTPHEIGMAVDALVSAVERVGRSLR